MKSSREIRGSINIYKFLSFQYQLTAGPNINEESSQERIRPLLVLAAFLYL